MSEAGDRGQGSEVRVGRRSVLAGIAAAAFSGTLPLADAQHVHQAAAADTKAAGGIYKPKAFTDHEFATMRTLFDIIVPGASKGHAAEFVDILAAQNNDLLAIFTGGLAWLDFAMKKNYDAPFLTAKSGDQTAMLDQIAYRKNETPELAAGIRFFVWARRMAVDGYYTSAAGIKEIGFMGNGAVKEFQVPQEAIDYAVKRSPFAAG